MRTGITETNRHVIWNWSFDGEEIAAGAHAWYRLFAPLMTGLSESGQSPQTETGRTATISSWSLTGQAVTHPIDSTARKGGVDENPQSVELRHCGWLHAIGRNSMKPGRRNRRPSATIVP